MISRILKTSSLLFIFSFILTSCITTPPGKKNPEYVGTYYILSNSEFSKVDDILTLKHDGSFTSGSSDSSNFNIFKNFSSWKVIDNKTIILFNKDNDTEYVKLDLLLYEKKNKVYFDCEFVQDVNISIISNNIKSDDIYSYVRNSYNLKALQKIIEDKKRILESQKKWDELNKKSINAILNFLKENPDNQYSKEATELLHSLLDKKVQQYLKKKYKSFTPHINSMICLNNGTEICTLSEALRLPVLGIVPSTGFKIDFDLNRTKNKINLIISDNNNSECIIILRPFKNKLIAEGYTQGLINNPNHWEYIVNTIMISFSGFPDNENIDFDLINSLK